MADFPIDNGPVPTSQLPIALPGAPVTPRNEQGRSGLNAYQLAKLGGYGVEPFVGTFAEYMASLRGEVGPPGDEVESQARIAADQALSVSISTEAAARAAADQSLSVAAASEATARAAADQALAAADSAEAQTRATADQALAAATAAEAQARATADQTLSTAVTTEATTRAAADQTLANAVAAEVAAARAAESAIGARIDSLPTTGGYSDPAAVPVVIVFGGANAGGTVPVSEASGEAAEKPGTWMFNNTNLVFEPYLLGTNNSNGHTGQGNSTHYGFDLPLALSQEAGTWGDVQLYLFKAGHNASTIVSWQPENGSGFWETFYTRWLSARAAIFASGKRPTPYILYSHGLDDVAALTFDNWVEDTKDHIARMRALVGFAPVVLMLFKSPAHNELNVKIAQVVAETPFAYLIAATPTSVDGNGLRLDADGLDVMTARFLDAALNKVGQGGTYIYNMVYARDLQLGGGSSSDAPPPPAPTALNLRFTGADDGDWNNLSNWLDHDTGNAATRLPRDGDAVWVLAAVSTPPEVSVSLDTILINAGSVSVDISDASGPVVVEGNTAVIGSLNGQATFRGTSSFNGYIFGLLFLEDSASSTSTVSGALTMSGNSTSADIVTGDLNMTDAASFSGAVAGDLIAYHPVNYPVGGTVSGSRAYVDYPTLTVVAAPVISGSTAPGADLTVTSAASFGGAVVTSTGEWIVNGLLTGITATTYTAATTVGDILYYLARATNPSDTLTTAASNSITVQAIPAAPENVVIPLIVYSIPTGVFSTTTGSWANSPVSFAYQWYRNGSPIGTNSTTLNGASFNNGDAVHCVVTATNPVGSGNASTATYDIGSPVTSLLIDFDDNTGGSLPHQVSVTPTAGGAVASETLNAGDHSYTAGGLAYNTSYTVTVTSVDGLNNSVPLVVNVSTAPFYPPLNLTAVADGFDRLDVSWDEPLAPPLGGYILETSPDGTSWTARAVIPVGTLTYTHTGLAELTTVHYRVRSYNANDDPHLDGFGPYSDPAIGVTDERVVVYYLNEDFEGTGAPAGWTNGGSGWTNFDFTGVTIHSGQALNFDSDGNNYRWAEYAFGTPLDAVHLAGAARFSSTGVEPRPIMLGNGSAWIASFGCNQYGKVQVYGAAGNLLGESPGVIINSSTVFYFWISYIRGTGANSELSITISATATRPAATSANSVVLVGGNLTAAITVLRLTSAQYTHIAFDHLKATNYPLETN